MITQILNQMYELHENIKTSEDLIDFLQKAKPLYLKGLELCDKLESTGKGIYSVVRFGEPLRPRELWSIIDSELNILDGLCELKDRTKPNCVLDYWDESLKKAMHPYDIWYGDNSGLGLHSNAISMRESFNLRIELIDKMLVIAKSKYNEH